MARVVDETTRPVVLARACHDFSRLAIQDESRDCECRHKQSHTNSLINGGNLDMDSWNDSRQSVG